MIRRKYGLRANLQKRAHVVDAKCYCLDMTAFDLLSIEIFSLISICDRAKAKEKRT